MKIANITIFIILMVSSYSHSQTHHTSSVKSYKMLLNNAHQHFYNQQYQKALELYQQSYQYKPLDSTLYNIAICYFKLENWQAALKSFRQLQPDTDQANLITYNIGVVYKKLGKKEKALKIFQFINKNSKDKKLIQLATQQVKQLTARLVTQKKVAESNSLWYGSLNISYGADDDVVDPAEETDTSTSDNFVETLATAGWLNNAQSNDYWGIDIIYYGYL